MAGKIEQAKGRVKATAGALTGNRKLEAQGHVDQATGKAKEIASKVAHRMKKGDCGCGC